MTWAAEELRTVDLGDERLDRRLVKAVEALAEQAGRSVPQACGSAAAAKAVYRFWDNEHVDAQDIRAAHTMATCARCLVYPVVLAIQDTTSLDFTGHRAVGGLGYLERGHLRGLKVHSTLAASEDGVPLGLLDQKVWVRADEELGKKKDCHQKLTQDKESQRWIDALQSTQALLAALPCVITVCDAEADIFDLLAQPRPANSHVLIRVAQSRRVEGEYGRLFEALAQAPQIGTERLWLGSQEREATLVLRSMTVSIRPPANGLHKGQQSLTLQALLAEEIAAPAESEPIRWRLLTSLPVTGLADVQRCLRLYARRWLIERWHYTLKSGCGVEKLQLESAERLQRALATYCIVAWRLLWLTYLARMDESVPCTVALRPYEWQSLYCTHHRTRQLPEQPPSLRQAVRWIAQLGGFLARKGDGEPGVKVLWRGLQRLLDISNTWQLLQPTPSTPDQLKFVGNA